MRRFLYASLLILLLLLAVAWLYFGGYWQPPHRGEVTNWTKSEGKTILVDQGAGFVPFEIKGVNLGAGKPGYHATDFGIEYEDYMRWFSMIQEMGANTIRVYTVHGPAFYHAFYDYNKGREEPLYLLHGLWLDDYANFSHIQGYDREFRDTLIRDACNLVDLLHGKKLISLGEESGSGFYRWDVSEWTLGYLLGVEWEAATVIYTNKVNPERNHYEGRYLSTTLEASPFEAILAELGDRLIDYESRFYGQQRMIAFSNWPVTDPLDYTQMPAAHFRKIAQVDVEHLRFSADFQGGTFASYHIYAYVMDYYYDLTHFIDESGQVNTYLAYLKKINEHHSIPVVITEFGIPSSRGMSREEPHQGRSQGHMNETEQAAALLSCYEDIKKAGCAGSVVFSWQDEWFKRTWNTLPLTDTLRTPYWSDYQTNEQFFGLLTFDPGKNERVCQLDGKNSEWSEADLVLQDGPGKLYSKQDERYLYFMIQQAGLNEESKLSLPLDITPKSGAKKAVEQGLQFERPADFLILLQGKTESRVLVQERYDAFQMQYQRILGGRDAFVDQPAVDSTIFSPIKLPLQTPSALTGEEEVEGVEPETAVLMDDYETGLLAHGNGVPDHPDYNSLADFCYGEGMVEIRLPWLLLNFSCPAEGLIHDDYYEHYGVENLNIKEFYIGIGQAGEQEPIPMQAVALRPWYDRPTYHERLKPAYYAMQGAWKEGS